MKQILLLAIIFTINIKCKGQTLKSYSAQNTCTELKNNPLMGKLNFLPWGTYTEDMFLDTIENGLYFESTNDLKKWGTFFSNQFKIKYFENACMSYMRFRSKNKMDKDYRTTQLFYIQMSKENKVKLEELKDFGYNSFITQAPIFYSYKRNDEYIIMILSDDDTGNPLFNFFINNLN